VELSPGLHRVEAPLGDRYVALYLVVGSEAVLLVDTGLDESILGTLEPYLRSVGIAPERIRYVVNTHADFDHTGGNAAIKLLVPDCVLMCGEDDRRLINDIDLMIGERYGEFGIHGVVESEETNEFIRSAAKTVPVDIGLRGGERIDLGGRVVEILHTPGHSWGHVSVHDVMSNSLMIGDAVLFNTLLTADGHEAFPPTYRYVDTYRGTIRRLAAMSVAVLLTAHYPVYRGSEAADFFAESLAYTDRVESVLLDTLREAAKPLTLLEIVAASRERLGVWPAPVAEFLTYPLLGHIEALEQRGVIATTPSVGQAGAVTPTYAVLR
jgi:glyoxylase-like metal-dependent hydrolase (beta-lactamase superfamily II)